MLSCFIILLHGVNILCQLGARQVYVQFIRLLMFAHRMVLFLALCVCVFGYANDVCDSIVWKTILQEACTHKSCWKNKRVKEPTRFWPRLAVLDTRVYQFVLEMLPLDRLTAQAGKMK